MQSVDLQEPYTDLNDIGMIWRTATPSKYDRQTQDGTLYEWSDYIYKVTSIILARNGRLSVSSM